MERSLEISLKHLDISLSVSKTIKPPGLSEMPPGGWLIPPSEINLDIDCVRCVLGSVWVFESDRERERQCLIETEPVGSVIYGLFRSSFPRVHSSLPSTRRQGAKPLLSPSQWSNLSSLRKGKGCLCLSQLVQRHLIFFNHFTLICVFCISHLWFIVWIVLCWSFCVYASCTRQKRQKEP